MKRRILLIFLFLSFQSIQWSNPIDNTPLTLISELVFDNNGDWTMELGFAFGGYWKEATDSIVIKVAGKEAKINITYASRIYLAVINSDSLTAPLSINRQGDTVRIFTYSNVNEDRRIREYHLIFGDCAGSVVGKPVDGYSIYNVGLYCLTKNSSLGIANTSVGLNGIMQGHIYDVNGNLIVKLQPFGVIGHLYFELETPITIDSLGTYTTKIYNMIYKPGHLYIYATDFPGWQAEFEIDSFELKDIQPDTLVIQDIHLKGECSYCQVLSAIEENVSSTIDEFRLINYPNPFNSSTNFFINIPSFVKGKQMNINIYDINGRLVRNIPVMKSTTLNWDGKDEDGIAMSSGIYLYNLNIDCQLMKSGSMILLK